MWFRKAAEQGLARAQYNLGVGYYQGAGVPQDYVAAARWFRMAAEAGGLERLLLAPGARARVEASGEEVVVAEPTDRGYRLRDGRVVDEVLA